MQNLSVTAQKENESESLQEVLDNPKPPLKARKETLDAVHVRFQVHLELALAGFYFSCVAASRCLL